MSGYFGGPEREQHGFGGSSDSPLHADQIGSWSQADLRRFVVNLLLSDPGALPKEVSGPSQQLPAGATDGSVPVWDSASNRWVTSLEHPAPGSDLADTSVALAKLASTVPYLVEDYAGDGTAGTKTFSSLPSDRKHLLVLLSARASAAVQLSAIYVRFNGDSGANYTLWQMVLSGSAFSAGGGTAATAINTITVPGNSALGSRAGAGILFIPNFADTNLHKSVWHFGGAYANTGAAQQDIRGGVGHWGNTAAITSVLVGINNPNYTSGTRISLYAF